MFVCDFIVRKKDLMKFEWDSKKEKINLKKHKIDFNLAKLVFYDEFMMERYDINHSDYEDRYMVIGSVLDSLMVITVIYTERADAIRIISARKANSEERKAYYDNKKKCGFI